MVIGVVKIPVVFIAVIAAVFFAMEAVLVKRGINAGGNPHLAAIVVAGVSTVLFAIVLVLSSQPGAVANRSLTELAVFFLAGVGSNGIGILAIYHGVERVGASINTAVVNSRPLFAALLGSSVLSETVEPTTAGGIVVLVAGLVVVALSRGGDVTGWRPIELTIPLLAAMSLAFSNMARRYGLTETQVSLTEGIAINALGGLLVLLIFVAIRRRKEIFYANRRAYIWFLLTGFSTSIGLLAMFVALERERVAIVDSIVALSPLFTLVLTAVLLREYERINLRVCLGVSLVVAGVIAIVGL